MKKQLFLLISLLSLTSCNMTRNNSSVSAKESISQASNSDDDLDSNEESSTVENMTFSVQLQNLTSYKNIRVQWCTDTLCHTPMKVSDTGYVTNTLPKDETYYIHLMNLDSAYAYDPNGYVASSSNPNITLPISTIESMENNTISKAGVYKISVEKDSETSITFSTAGSYTIESWVDYSLASEDSELDPKITFGSTSDDNSGFNNNFKLDVKITESDNIVKFSANKKASYIINVTSK